MTKKLFVVLVVVFAMLISFALVMGAKQAIKVAPERYEKQVFSNKQHAVSMPDKAAITKKVALDEQSGRPQKGEANKVPVSGTPLRQGTPSGKDLCVLAGTPAYFLTGWLYGLEYWANYQDPAAFGCTAVWPFQPTEIDMQINIPAWWVEGPVTLQGFILSDVGTSCPLPGVYPGDVICSTSVYTFTVPAGGGYFEFPLPLTEQCCVNQPYFAAVYVGTDFYTLSGLDSTGVDPVSDNIPLACRSYNGYGDPFTWYDINAWGSPGSIMLYTQGYTHPQNPCPAAGDTCGVSSITPATISLLAGGTADFTANVYFQGAQTSCFLTVTPDPACPTCVTTITPNPVLIASPSATISIATSASTAPGTYVFDVGGSKASATLIVLAPDDSCQLARYTAGSGYYFGSWAIGDQNAVLLDPAACISCGPNPYPFQIQQVVSRWVNSGGATSSDVIFHIYQAGTQCSGPGTEIYQFPVHITAWSPNYIYSALPNVICVNGPFWVSAEYIAVTPPTAVFPSLRFSTQTYADTCTQYNFYQGSWYEWGDFWSPPLPGYYYMGAIGQCQGTQCPIECDMQNDNGAVQNYGSFHAAGDRVGVYYNPEDFCAPPVYPYKVKTVTVDFYKYAAAAPSVDIKIGIYYQSQFQCDGPGTKIYESPKYTVTTFHPTLTTFVLPDVVCLYKPFFVAVEFESGVAGQTPSVLYDNKTIPIDTCLAWFYFASQGYSPPWIEWYDMWGAPVPGRPLIRVSGSTNDPDCNNVVCDTTIETLAGGTFPYYIWRNPSRYGDNYLAEQFQMPADHGGRLESFDIAFYQTGSTGTPNPKFFVWLSDGAYPLDSNPPYGAIAEFDITYADIAWYPGITSVSAYAVGIDFVPDELFHIGYGHAYNNGDTLRVMSDDGSSNSVRGTEWIGGTGPWGNMLDDWGVGVDYMINAYICPVAPSAPTFTMKCAPATANGTPGDPPTYLYDITINPVIGYADPITISLLSVNPAQSITANFTPNGVAAPFVSAVDIIVGVGVPYGDYTLTFQAVGADNQTKVCDVNLTVQPPFDEAVVNFFHGVQRTSNFGAIGNAASSANFTWYGTNYLFDGSIISVTPVEPLEEHMALDMYDCTHMGFIPSQHIVLTHAPWCAASMYEENYGEVAYSNFYTDEDVVSCEWDSLYVVGLVDVPSTDFSIKIKIYYNPTTTPIPALYPSIFEDWDINGGTADWANMDTLHNFIYQYDSADPSLVFGTMIAPFDNLPAQNMISISNVKEVYPPSQGGDSSLNCGVAGAPGPAYLARLVMSHQYRMPGYWGEAAGDHSILISSPPFSLNPGEKHIEVWFDFGRNTADGFTWEQWYHRLLRYAGFYRGDVNASDTLELPALDISDLVYLINYLYQAGPVPQPFIDQGNVDGKGPYGGPIDTVCPKNNVDIQDLVYLVNYVFKSGPAPVDYVRFIPSFWSRPSLFTNPNW